MDRVPEGNGPQRLQDHNDALAARLREEDEDVRCRVRLRFETRFQTRFATRVEDEGIGNNNKQRWQKGVEIRPYRSSWTWYLAKMVSRRASRSI